MATVSLATIADSIGLDLGSTEWMTITQDRVNQFADATDDHQWIHIDVERAKSGPFGGPIAHGYLTLSLIPQFLPQLLQFEGAAMSVNYGADKLRFTTPVPVGARVRMTGKLVGAEPKAGGTLVRVATAIEIEGSERPAMVTDVLYLVYPK